MRYGAGGYSNNFYMSSSYAGGNLGSWTPSYLSTPGPGLRKCDNFHSTYGI